MLIIRELEGNGDFRSAECLKYLEEADVVITNPPFSLFREYVAQLMEYNKKFIIIGNMNAVTYKEIFPLIKNNQLWLGQNAKGGSRKGNSMTFINNGEKADVSSWWFTNVDNKRRNEMLDLFKKYNEKEFPKYDNYDAIECGKSCNVPMDYNGVIGVPISFLMFHNPNQFEIVGIMSGARGEGLINGNDGRVKFYVGGKGVYARILIRRK